MTPNTPADVASLPAKWREEVRQHDQRPSLSYADICTRDTLRACADELEAALTPAGEGGLPATPSSRWAANGEPDPHGNRYDCERAKLAGGEMTDDEVANAMFLRPSVVNITIAKDRIRWLSRRLATTEQPGSSVQVQKVIGFRWRLKGSADLAWAYCYHRSPDSFELRECDIETVWAGTPPPAPAAEQGDALAAFTDYFVRNYPGPDTVIMDPRWHASRIFRAAQYAISAATQPEARGVEWADGVKACIAWVEKRRHDFEAEYGMLDPTTNAVEFRNTAREEYDCELVEIEEGLRAMLAAAPEAVRVDANLDAALNAAVSDLDMLAQGRDTVTGDPLTPMDSRRIATNALSALTRAWAAALAGKDGANQEPPHDH